MFRVKKMRLLSVFLVVTMILQLLQYNLVVNAGIITDEIWVGGVNIINHPENIPENVDFDSTTNTLTLSGANITMGHLDAENNYAGIYSNVNLNLVITGGDSTINISTPVPGEKSVGILINNANLNISGDGELTINSNDDAILTYGAPSENQANIEVREEVVVNANAPIVAMGDPNNGNLDLYDSSIVNHSLGYTLSGQLTIHDQAQFNEVQQNPEPGPNPGPGPSTEPLLYINGVNLSENPEAIIEDVTIIEYSNTIARIQLNNANLEESVEGGNSTSTIYVANMDLEIEVIGDNYISAIANDQTDRMFAIEAYNSNVTFSGDGNLTLNAPERTIDMFSNNIDVDLIFNDNLNVTSYGAFTIDENNSKIILNDNVYIQVYGDIRSDLIEVNNNAVINPIEFIINGNSIDVDESAFIGEEGIIAEGEGYIIEYKKEFLQDEGYGILFTLSEYEGGPVTLKNYDGPFSLSGNINISKDIEGFSINLINTRIQTWGDINSSEVVNVNLEGGINMYYSEFNAWYSANWFIGTKSNPSPKGFVGINKKGEVSITRDKMTVYTENSLIEDIDRFIVQDKAIFKGYSQGKAILNVNSLEVASAGEIDIIYEDAEKIIDDNNLLHLTSVFKSDSVVENNELTTLFPESSQYFINSLNNQYQYKKTSPWSPENDTSIQGETVSQEDRKYSLSDNGSRYVFLSKANKVVRVFADDDNSMIGGTLDVIAVNGYNFGGYVVEVGEIAYVRVLPYKGYQYKPGSLLGSEGLEISATDQPGIYSFIMPDAEIGIPLSAEFVPSEDMVDNNSDVVKASSFDVPDNTIQHGNARLSINDLEDEESRKLINNQSNGYEIGALVDIDLDEVITKNGSETNVWAKEISEIEGEVNIELDIDETIEGYKYYSVARIHEGNVDILEAVYENGVLSFNTDRFSTYAILYSNEIESNEQAPETSDSSPIIWFVVILFSQGIIFTKLRKSTNKSLNN